MRLLLRRGAFLGGLLLLSATALMLILLLGLRLIVPLVEDYRIEIEQRLSARLGYPVEVGGVRAEWRDTGPSVTLVDVRLMDLAQRYPLWTMGRVRVQFDLLRSLYALAPRVGAIVITGANLHLVRRADGRIEVYGVNLSEIDEAHARSPLPGFRDLSFRLRSSQVRWQDELTRTDHRFTDIDLQIQLKPDQQRFSGVLQLPPELGRQLSVVAEINGKLDEPHGWGGRFYLKGASLRFGELLRQQFELAFSADRGTAEVEGWGELHGGKLTRFHGYLAVQDVHLTGIDERRLPALYHPSLDLLEARFAWSAASHGWRLEVDDLVLSRNDSSWFPSGLSVSYRRDDSGRRLRAALDYARFEDVIPFLMAQPELLDAELLQQLYQLQPAGELIDLNIAVELPFAGTARFACDGEVQDLAFASVPGFPGVDGADGQFSFNEESGAVLFDSTGIEFDYPRLFEGKLWVDALSGLVSWSIQGSNITIATKHLTISNNDIGVNGRMSLSVGERAPHLDLQLAFGGLNGAHAARYLPVRVLPPKVHEWLRAALTNGRVVDGGLIFLGNVTDYPFAGGEGVFETRFRVAELDLDYWRDWPRLERLEGEIAFRNRSMRAAIVGGELYGSRVSSAEVRIADFKRAVLSVQAQAEGPLSDVFRFLEQSPLGRRRQAEIRAMQAEGMSRLSVAIELPLSRRIQARRSVRGDLHFGGCALDFSRARVGFDEVVGRLSFDQSSVSADDVRARFRGNPITVDAETTPSGEIVVDFSGAIDIASAITELPRVLRVRTRGSALWHAQLKFPFFGQQRRSQPPALRLWSNLEGVEIDLPAPFAKSKSVAHRLRIETELGTEVRAPLTLTYEGLDISAIARFLRTRDAIEFNRGAFLAGDGEAELPERGVAIKGLFDRLDIGEWRELMADLAPSRVKPGVDNGWVGAADDVDIDIQVKHLAVAGRQIRSVALKVRKGRSAWWVRVDSPALKGSVQVPVDTRTGIPVTFEMDHVIWTPLADKQPTRIDPTTLPSIRFNSKRVVWDGREFSDVRLEATRRFDGIQLHHLHLSAPEVDMRAHGEWRLAPGDQQRSGVRFSMTSGDFGNALEHLGFSSSLRGGEAKIEGDLRWPEGPTNLSASELSGKVRVRIKDGELHEVQPGAGRVLGLFSLNSLPRRLTLDFRDLFNKGFTFDTLDANLTIHEGDIYTNDMKIAGPPANIEIRGRMGLAAKDYDHLVIVEPQVRSTLPVAGALVGGWNVGALLFVADKFLAGIGKTIDKAARVEYRVSGTWDNPVIAAISKQPDVEEMELYEEYD